MTAPSSRLAAVLLQIPAICERFHRTVLDEFCRVAFRKKEKLMAA
jgi:hypothetical protein